MGSYDLATYLIATPEGHILIRTSEPDRRVGHHPPARRCDFDDAPPGVGQVDIDRILRRGDPDVDGASRTAQRVRLERVQRVRATMSRLQWPDSPNSLSDDPGTIQTQALGRQEAWWISFRGASRGNAWHSWFF